MARLIVSPESSADIDGILDWLDCETGRPVALRYAERFRAAFGHLMAFPEIGARRRTLHANMRIWVVAPYVIFYRFEIDKEPVTIVRILHGRRDLAEALFRS
jgi:plasmid stabilization system protein ParE